MLAASAVSTGPATASELIAYFDHGSAEITQSAWGRLQAAACYAAEAAAVQVVAHTDRSGTEAYNQALSERRAQAVADALGRLGFNRAFIRPVGRGETQPAAPTSDGVREPLNRRASININFAPGAPAGLPAACSSDPLGSRR
jgi:outer membrane protein OmpA-like peptidoglycan-associated protein